MASSAVPAMQSKILIENMLSPLPRYGLDLNGHFLTSIGLALVF
jgi:hypothetical protein